MKGTRVVKNQRIFNKFLSWTQWTKS